MARSIVALVVLLTTALVGALLTSCRHDDGNRNSSSSAASSAAPSSVATAPITVAPTSSSRSSGTARTTTTAKRSTPLTSGRLAPADAVTDLPTVTLDELPPQAITTLRLIAAGGPFPYRQDGVVFENRERHLPRQRSGYYHEYTVVTPGSPDRGARRIIAGTSGERFYTADHYSSFREVIQP